MKIISRQAAKAAGLKFYYTGKPCSRGHLVAWPVRTGTCPECTRLREQQYHNKNPLRTTYNSLLQRCCNENRTNFEHYGGRGITVCDRWLDPENGYENFVVDMGPRPEGFTLDRIDPDGGYCPENCRWADWATQCRNQRRSKLKGEDVLEIYRLVDAGVTQQRVSEMYNCGKSTIWWTLKHREKYIEAGLGRGTQAAA